MLVHVAYIYTEKKPISIERKNYTEKNTMGATKKVNIYINSRKEFPEDREKNTCNCLKSTRLKEKRIKNRKDLHLPRQRKQKNMKKLIT